MNGNATSVSTRLGWRTRDWRQAVGVGDTTARRLIREKIIPSAKVGKCRVILISPADFLERASRGT